MVKLTAGVGPVTNDHYLYFLTLSAESMTPTTVQLGRRSDEYLWCRLTGTGFRDNDGDGYLDAGTVQTIEVMLGSDLVYEISGVNMPYSELQGGNAWHLFAGADEIGGSELADELSGLGGNDIVHGNGGDDELWGGAGNDVVYGGAGDDTVRGGDSFEGRSGFDRLFGGDGDDSLGTDAGKYLIDGGAGSDSWGISFYGLTTSIIVDAADAASESGWSLGGDRLVRNVENLNISFGSGDDTFRDHDGGGDDYIELSSGSDTAYVNSGRDVVFDYVFAENEDAGVDRIFIDYSAAAAAGLTSRLSADQGVHLYWLWEGSDREAAPRSIRTGGFDRVTIIGSGLSDRVVGTDGSDHIEGGAGNDVLTAQLGRDVLDGGTGSDTLSLEFSALVWFPLIDLTFPPSLLSGATIDLDVTASQILPSYDSFFDGIKSLGEVTLRSMENIVGTRSADELYGSSEDNRLMGRGGHDLLSGRAGDDRLLGGGGDDLVVGGAGADVLNGGAGNDTVSYGGATTAVTVDLGAAGAQDTGAGGLDTLSGFENAVGGSAVDRLVGTDAANILDGGAGADTMVGRLGNDIYLVDDSADRAVEYDSWGGIDTVRSSADFTLGARVEDLVLTGATAIDGTGQGGANAITGNRAANVLRGEGGNDVLAGAGGDDSLFGGFARDTLMGGGGEDDFCFDTALGWNNEDWLGDFNSGDDTIMLDRDIFSGIGNGTLSATAFHSGKAAADENDRIVYDETTGRIFYDADGAGGAGAIFFARVEPGTTLTHADFVGHI